LDDKGLFICKEEDIEHVENKNNKTVLYLRSGKNIECDCLIVGKGVKPNIELASESGVKTNYGVLIDEYCQTNDPDIFAAGDVAEGYEFDTKRKVIQGNWITAVEQAEIAAKNILGLGVTYDGSFKCNITKVFGVGIAVVGIINDNLYETDKYYNPIMNIYRKYFIDNNGIIRGVVLINNTDEAGIYYGLIKQNMLYEVIKNIIRALIILKF